MNPFEWTKSICETKENLIKNDLNLEKEYTPFLVNRALSYYSDTIFFASEMDRHSSLPKKLQYDFYFYGIPKRKRFAKWVKKIPESKDIQLIMDHYLVNQQKAIELLSLLNKEQLEELRDFYFKGGK